MVINHPLFASSIYYDPWHPLCSIYVPDSLFPQSLCKQEVGKPSRNAAQPCDRVQCYVNDDLRADERLQKGWEFRVSTWNVDSLTGRAGEVVEASSDSSYLWPVAP